ncbi:MAG: class I SAM-dependent methyltransferase [Deltaproteobacteria bacterium]|nr:class I SAM-dependent methyltransferase [Deltaproteobacteria bacterium]
MDLHKTLVKSALLKLMRLIEAHSNYYLARNNQFYPFVNPIVGIRNSPSCAIGPKEAWAYGLDKVQHGMTQLMSHEVYQQNIEGAIAELGVFRGFNASVMNHFFPDRKLYLFDTFEGFDPRDLKAEEQLGYNTNNYDDFSDTNIALVMSKMSHKENIIIRKGWFPDSAVGLEDETFCFVSLDPDLYQPIYMGLHWFYPRLAKGGYIIVDDYNWNDYPGAKKAVRDFSREVGISYIPIPNTTGSIVIGKPLIS